MADSFLVYYVYKYCIFDSVWIGCFKSYNSISMLKVILIDDEAAPLDILDYFLNRYFVGQVQVVDRARNIDEAYRKILQHNPDLIFLDFNMPRGFGYDLLERFPVRRFDVIVMTAYPAYRERAMQYGILGFLDKPLDPDDFRLAVQAVIEKRRLNPEGEYFLRKN